LTYLENQLLFETEFVLSVQKLVMYYPFLFVY